MACSAGLCACAGRTGTGSHPVIDWPKSDGRFRAELLITDQHEHLERDWIDAVTRGRYPTIATVDHVRKGRKVHVILLFSNCIEIKDDICRMTVNFSVTKPDGNEYGTLADRTLWSGELPARDRVFLGGPYMSFEAEPVDPEGQYRVTAVVRGADGSVSVEVTRLLVVTGERN